MRKSFIYYILSLFLMSSCHTKNNEYKLLEYDDPGYIRTLKVATSKEDMENGNYTFTGYFKNGATCVIKHFKNGLPDGEHLEYNEKGQLILMGMYKDGIRHGVIKTFAASGRRRMQGLILQDTFMVRDSSKFRFLNSPDHRLDYSFVPSRNGYQYVVGKVSVKALHAQDTLDRDFIVYKDFYVKPKLSHP